MFVDFFIKRPVFATVCALLIILAGGYLVLHGHTTVGTVFVFATVLGARLAGAASSLAGMHVNVTGSLALFRRLFDYIDLPPEDLRPAGREELSRMEREWEAGATETGCLHEYWT